jgi:hypothetical protein
MCARLMINSLRERMFSKHKAVARAALIALSASIAGGAAYAGAADYEFQLVEPNVKQGDGAVVAVRLIDKRSGATVPDAVIFATRLDMEPDGMETMTTPVEQTPSTEPGVYRYRTNLVMAGGWRFSLAAKVQGEAETVQAKLVLRAIP